MNKLLLIDGNSVANRAFYALPLLNNEKGMYTNAVLGFTNMLLRMLEEERPTHVLVAFDAGKVTFRHSQYKEYKGKRQKSPHELGEQFPLIQQMLDAFSIAHYELDQYEADDIIGTLSKEADEEGWETKIVTGDKDMLQLISDHTHVALTRKGISEVEHLDLDKLLETYKLHPSQIIDLKGLMGDSSDNIPGVPGVGEKTALKLLHQFETIERVYQQLDQVSGKKLNERLTEHKDQALLSKQLATIMRDAPLQVGVEDTKYPGYEREKVIPFLEEMGFDSILERLGEGKTLEDENVVQWDVHQIKASNDPVLDQALESPAAFHVEVMEDNYHRAPILGISICNQNGMFFLSTEVALASDRVKQWLGDVDQEKWVYDGKRLNVALRWQGVQLAGITFDLFLASYLLNPSEAGYNLDTIAKTDTDFKIHSDEQVYGKGAKRKVPEHLDSLIQHISAKAKVIYAAKHSLQSKLDDQEMLSLLKDLELPLNRVLSQMEVQGIQVERDTLRQMGKELNHSLEKLTEQIYELAGGIQFNINSPKQLGEVLFDKLNLPVIKKTKTGYSTSADVLEKLEPQHEIISHLLHYRQLKKLESTYIAGLLREIHEETGKVHTIFQQAVTSTGRLSSTDPNLQNIPIRLEEGRKIRKAFVPSTQDRVILAADYSQIELRVLAHIAQDPELIRAFKEDLDIHTKTAMDVFHVEEDDVTSLMRRHAKAVNFGIVYGISDYGLSQSLQISRKEAKEFIERYFESYPKVQQFMEDIIKQAKEDGYVTTMLKRRRYLADINSRNFNMRSFAERTAMNTPIQGTAADIIKKAMVEIVATLDEKRLQSILLLQVHDELIFEVPEQEIETMVKLVPEVMESTVQLDVPLKVDIEYGQTWYDAK